VLGLKSRLGGGCHRVVAPRFHRVHHSGGAPNRSLLRGAAPGQMKSMAAPRPGWTRAPARGGFRAAVDAAHRQPPPRQADGSGCIQPPVPSLRLSVVGRRAPGCDWSRPQGAAWSSSRSRRPSRAHGGSRGGHAKSARPPPATHNPAGERERCPRAGPLWPPPCFEGFRLGARWLDPDDWGARAPWP